jgi:hypothetical protein
VGSRARLDAVVKRNNSCPFLESSTGRPARNLVTVLTEPRCGGEEKKCHRPSQDSSLRPPACNLRQGSVCPAVDVAGILQVLEDLNISLLVETANIPRFLYVILKSVPEICGVLHCDD